jgi:hypothetical protein
MRGFSLRHVKNKWRYKSGENRMSNTHNDDNLDNRLSLTDLKKIKKYKDISDEEGEIIINDTLALARMILDIID